MGAVINGRYYGDPEPKGKLKKALEEKNEAATEAPKQDKPAENKQVSDDRPSASAETVAQAVKSASK